MKIWILTETWNDYNQHGDVFVAAFLNKPTEEQLKEYGVDEFEMEHVLIKGGGRLWMEDYWFNLFQVDA
jgi:hypothetical protein